MDECHDTACGQAIKERCERAYAPDGENDCATLAMISVSYLYRLGNLAAGAIAGVFGGLVHGAQYALTSNSFLELDSELRPLQAF